ncbi:MAG TPA: FAD-dependent oxidoreductase [Candidatus Acidoferrum sp.]|nr:FAD-dependent oxidoreductase [Candidatus Acidoferrum sp.]
MNSKHVVVVGSSFAGFTAAVELRRMLDERHQVTVISKSDEFLFMPSLIWVPFRLRTREDITFAVGPALARHGIRFRHDAVTRLDLDRRLIATGTGDERYDYLVLATGSKPNYGAIPGLGPRGYTESIMTLPEAERARTAFDRFVAAPGPVVVGSVQGASSHAAAYEFLFSMACELRTRRLAERAPLTYLTGEPSLAHFGRGGLGSAVEITAAFLDTLAIRAITSAAVQAISPGEIRLADGQTLPFAYAMLVPPLLGVDVVRACDQITNASGFVRVNQFYQTAPYPDVFAAGVAVAEGGSSTTEEMAKVVANNIAAEIRGGTMIPRPS